MKERSTRVSTDLWKVGGTHHDTAFREQRQLQPKAPQTETAKKSKPAPPRNQEALRVGAQSSMGGTDRMGLGAKAAWQTAFETASKHFQKTNGFLFDIYFFPSPWHVCPSPFLKDAESFFVWWCGLETWSNTHIQSLGNMKLTQVRRGSRLREQSVQTGTEGQQTLSKREFYNTSKGSLGVRERSPREHSDF